MVTTLGVAWTGEGELQQLCTRLAALPRIYGGRHTGCKHAESQGRTPAEVPSISSHGSTSREVQGKHRVIITDFAQLLFTFKYETSSGQLMLS
eukprot:CAMPEP_0174361832 /NCGR_PEP_ID=MMETSP0811_2-20130205/61217_1 /TAXON_ID=73025 ORGANISM="Eutreptiella gymnastica-like, Strain CCMP1594" /NCGR_SAMPLE_ID=MMETSP0811_2 /ASSEMBLY_ACC=CAM_ASM_000667 /LENGTH=92 /DNA_ID=CAMNT_0015498853 /DNA_START=152 /DNA_END=426 /DNA_ORIENTATION=-